MSIGYPLEDGWQRKQRHQFNSSKLRCLGKTSSRIRLNACITFQPLSSRGFDFFHVYFNVAITAQIIVQGGPQLVGNMALQN